MHRRDDPGLSLTHCIQKQFLKQHCWMLILEQPKLGRLGYWLRVDSRICASFIFSMVITRYQMNARGKGV